MSLQHVLIFGRSGQAATELARRGTAQGIKVTGLGRDVADLSDPGACAAALTQAVAAAAGDIPVDAVINAAAWTAVDAAESDEDAAGLVNAEAPTALARAATEQKLPFLHISTDYVFDGTGDRPWRPTDPTAPLGAYGRTKLAGEDGVRAAGGAYAILRTAWVFSAHGANFVKTMLRLSETRDALTVVEDQIGCPTPAADIADALLTMADAMAAGQEGGTYHFGGQPFVSWADFARAIFDRAGRDVTVTGIPGADYPTPAKRPENSRLDCTTLKTDFGIAAPDWRTGLDDVLTELGARQ